MLCRFGPVVVLLSNVVISGLLFCLYPVHWKHAGIAIHIFANGAHYLSHQ